jgi:tetracycline resistance efflux pump
MINTWLVLLPACIVLFIAFLFKKLNYALFLGIISAVLIASNFALKNSLLLLINRFYSQITDFDNLYLYLFLIILGFIIALLEYSGGATAFAHLLTKHLRSKRATESASLLLSTSLFIDDYLSCLVTGFVMRPITDQFKIPRTKLAFLIHSFSAPLVILAPISSWVALITSSLDKAGVSPFDGPRTKILADPFYIYLKSIPFIFYSLLIIASVWFIVRLKISFGPMHHDELIAKETDNLFGGKKPIGHITDHLQEKKGSALDLILPIGILIISFIIGIAWSGGYYLFGGPYSFLQAIQHNTQTSLILFISVSISFIVSSIRALKNNTIKKNAFKKIIRYGVQLMYPSIIMVFLASTFGIILREDLQTGAYLANTFLHSVHIFLLPLIFYAISIVVALLTGSAWGTIALMVPIAIQMLGVLQLATAFMNPLATDAALTETLYILLFPCLGAIFSGAVCGNHVSPIAETTIMSSNSAGCYPLDHAYTQFWYALPAIICTALSFLISGLLLSYSPIFNVIASLSIGIVFCLLILYICNKIFKK